MVWLARRLFNWSVAHPEGGCNRTAPIGRRTCFFVSNAIVTRWPDCHGAPYARGQRCTIPNFLKLIRDKNRTLGDAAFWIMKSWLFSDTALRADRVWL